LPHACHHQSRANEGKYDEYIKFAGGKQGRHDWNTENTWIWVIFPMNRRRVRGEFMGLEWEVIAKIR
jgi:hypothetical protein